MATGGILSTVPLLDLSAANAASARSVPIVKAGSASISKTIQGYWQLAGGHGKYDAAAVVAGMADHCKAGITSFDTAGEAV